MLGIFLVIALIIAYVIISDKNKTFKENKGICKTTGNTCTSPTGCTCGEEVDKSIS